MNEWQMLDDLSDEFGGDSLDLGKWKNTDPNRWIGRSPGIFKENTVSLADGKMRITNYLLATSEWHNGKEFTHAGGHVVSKTAAQPGYYFEARIKANKTFMSSTFWLINYRNEGSGCDQRTTELDIQECVGQLTTTANWAKDFDQSMHSNTHSRNISCDEPKGSEGGNVLTGGKVWDDYHVYGAWWKSPTEVQFFLDGEHVYTVTPVADFDLPMYIKLVTETYDWNPVPSDGGMTGSMEERTTYYDWVRTWKLDAPTGCLDEVSFDPPASIASQNVYNIEIDYHACDLREVNVELWDDNWLGASSTIVNAGSGTITLTLELTNAPEPGDNYIWKTSIRPVGTDWQSNLDTDQKESVSVVPSQLIIDGRYVIKSKANGQFLGVLMTEDETHQYTALSGPKSEEIEQRWDFTHLGDNIYQIKLACCARYLEVPQTDCANGVDVSTYFLTNTDRQKWKISQAGTHYLLRPIHCLEQAMVLHPNSGSSQTADNDNVYTWAASVSSDNQLWEIIPNNTARLKAPVSPPALWASILPNPISQSELTVNFEYSNRDEVAIVIFDLTGHQLYQEQYQDVNSGAASVTIPQSEILRLSAGMYMLELRTDEVAEVLKFWVQ
ncbi:MAG: RICIN domain-containing protein [Bacteroidota bacterium]